MGNLKLSPVEKLPSRRTSDERPGSVIIGSQKKLKKLILSYSRDLLLPVTILVVLASY